VRTLICSALFRVFGHRLCCGRIPDWTAHVGQRWDTFDVAPWNLYNALWRAQQWMRRWLG
jgi:uncharacterized membrane protein